MSRKVIVFICLTTFFLILCCGCTDKVDLQITSGKINDDIEWKIENNVLEITGNGTVPSYDYFGNGIKAPWFSLERDIEQIVIGDGINSIGDFSFAFTGCERVRLPETLTEIGDYAFFCCKNLSAVEIPYKLETIGDYAFANCLGILNISIPDSVRNIGYNAFLNCASLEEINVGQNNIVYTSKDGVLFDKDMTELVMYPAGNKANAYSVPESVSVIGDNAFAYNRFLSLIEVSTMVKEIGEGTFAYSENLLSVKLPVGIEQIPSRAFFGCKSLVEFAVPAGVEVIGASAFSNCSALKNIVLPQSVTEIEKMAFNNCESIESIDLPDRIKAIPERAFAGCSSLVSVELPYMLEMVDSMAFSYCTALDKLVVYDSLSTVKAFAFRGCGKLRDIEYGGTREMWKNVNVEAGNDYLLKSVVSFSDDESENN